MIGNILGMRYQNAAWENHMRAQQNSALSAQLQNLHNASPSYYPLDAYSQLSQIKPPTVRSSPVKAPGRCEGCGAPGWKNSCCDYCGGNSIA